MTDSSPTTEACIFCGPDHPNGLRHSNAEIRAYERGLDEGRREAVREIRPETVTLDPPHPAYWRHILTEVIYNAIHHPPGGPKNVPSGQIAEAVVVRLLRAAPPLNASESDLIEAERNSPDRQAVFDAMAAAEAASESGQGGRLNGPR